jgi:hypothetical protein
MKTLYEDFSKLKLKDMSKSISDMTYKYINPDTQAPTKVPASHYEGILDQIAEKYISAATNSQFLSIMYNQLNSLKKEDEKYFYQALVCMDLGLNPKDLRINEQVAIEYIVEYIANKRETEKKYFHFLDERIVNAFREARDNQDLQASAVRNSNYYETKDNKPNNNRHYER